MDCINVKKILSRYQDNELIVKEREEVSAHLNICVDCKRELNEMENMISDLIKLETAPVPSNFKQKVMSQIYEREDKKTSVFPFSYVSLIYSMIFFVFLSFGFLFIDIDKPEKKTLTDDKADIYIASVLAREQELGLLDIQDSIISIIEDEVKDEN